MSDQKEKSPSQESITAAQPPEPLGYYSPQPKRRHTTSPVSAAEVALSNPAKLQLPKSHQPIAIRGGGRGRGTRMPDIGFASQFGPVNPPVQVQISLISADDAYDTASKFGGNLDLKRVSIIITGIAASGGCYYSIKNKYFTREMIDALREGNYHFHISERQSCPHCELPINVDGYICWNKGVIHDTPGTVIKNMCSCIAH